MGAASATVAGVKPAVINTGSGPVRVLCAMSVPRLGWQDHMFCWPRGLLPYGVSPVRLEGCFWGQCLERVMSEMVALDTDDTQQPLWILTIDYDFVYNNVVPANTAHFGFTLHRAAALKQMPHPWFIASPDSQGCWGDERIDEDIAYWITAKKAGLKIGICPRVSLGHAEVWFKWPDKNMQCKLQHPGDFWDNDGRPPEDAWK